MRVRRSGVVPSLLGLLVLASVAYAGVSKEMEAYYTQTYLNKAMFLKVPVRGDRQTVLVLEDGTSLDQSNLGEPLRFKVGEQVRITGLNFKDSSIEFKVASIDTARKGTIIFRFRNALRHSFASRESFESALESSFTEGLSYQEIDSAKEQFIQDQFDVLLRQFAVTTGTSVDFVLESVTENNPKYREVRKQLNAVTGRVQGLELELEEERSRNSGLRKEAEKAGSDLAAVNNTNRELRSERDRLAGERRDLEQKVKDLEGQNRQFRSDVEEIARKLDLETDSSSKLGQQVSSLSQVIDSLKQERVNLSGQVEGLSQKVEELTKQNGKLISDLQSSERKSKKLQSDLNALTSNRNSLEATYLSVKRNKENLERAKALETAIRVERSTENRENGTFHVSSLYLLSQLIAVLEVQEPVYADQDYLVTLQIQSPDTVEFTAEEREFYETLGEKFRVETGWVSASGRVEPLLTVGESLQEVAPREQADWTWRFQGVLTEPETVTLALRLIDVDDQVLEVASQEFQMSPSGVFARIRGTFSVSSLAIGLFLGVVGCVAIASLGRRGRSRQSQSGRKRGFEAQKRM
jgi:predicted  nucleic acid-binding Zn-ribbon protein